MPMHASAQLLRNASHQEQSIVMVMSAGTSDITVAEEPRCAPSCSESLAQVYDVGVAGIHRLTANLDTIREAAC